jgi:two-component system chemotaxis response regulator CheY
MKNILIVDDAATVRLYHRQILEAQGFQVYEAANGYEGLEKLVETPMDLLLVDINMPKMDGYSFMKRLRQDQQGLCGIPAIFISTEAELHDACTAYQVGGNLYLIKPVKPDALLLYVNLMTGNAT